MKQGDNAIVFESTGRSISGTDCDCIGLDRMLEPCLGWDSTMSEHIALTQAEKLELADHMIERWKAYKEAAGSA